jgi:hypothetical protein
VSRRIVYTLLYSLLLASACLAVLATRVSPEFERIRFRVVTAPRVAKDPVLAVALPDLTRLYGAPSAVVVRLRGTTEATTVTIALNATHLTTVTVPPGREIRVDASTLAPAGPGHQLILTGDRAGWQLAYMEIANVYGFSHGTLKFVIVPRERARDRPIAAWLLALFAVAVIAAQPRLDWPRNRILRVLHRAATAVVLLMFAVTLLVATFSRYRIVLSPETFLLLAAILYAEPLARLWRLAKPSIVTTFPRAAPFLPHAAVAVIVIWSVAQFYRPETGFTSLIVFGEQFEVTAIPALRTVAHAVDEGSGYDGQFYAQLALDPLLRSKEIVTGLDSAAYRGRRILLPWVAYLAGLGQPWYVLQAYALVNVVSWMALAVLLLRWLPPGALRPAVAWAACMLGDGLMTSMRQSVPDGPSMLLLALAVAAVERQRRGFAAGILGLAGLARETNLIGGLVLAPERVTARTGAALVLRGVAVVAPLVFWIGYLWYIGLSPVGAGLRNFAAPFAGYAYKWAATVHALGAEGWDSFARFSLLGLIALTTQFLVLLWQRDWRNPWWRMGAAYAGLMVVLGPAVWEGDPGAVTRVVVPMTIAFNVLLPKHRWFWPLWVLGNASVVHGFEVMRMPWLSGW